MSPQARRPTHLTLRQAYADRVRQVLEHLDTPVGVNQLAREHFPHWRARLDVALRDLERSGVVAVKYGRVHLTDSRESA